MSSQDGQRPMEIHIEEIMLQDFPCSNPECLKEAVIKALEQILADNPIEASALQSYEFANIDAGSFKADLGARPEILANNIAQGIYRGIRRTV